MKHSQLIPLGVAVSLFSLSLLPSARAAGSAIWNLNPPSNLWYGATNWTPATIPNNIADTATFGVSNTTSIFQAPGGLLADLGTFAFNPGASAYTINFAANLFVTSTIGAGVVNNSGVLQAFSLPASSEFRDVNETNNTLSFLNSATAGTLTQWTVLGSYRGAYRPGELMFNDSATGASATFIVGPGGSDIGGEDGDGFGGILDFRGSSTADHSTITVTGGLAGVDYGSPPDAFFTDNATAANATITTTAGTISLADGGKLEFYSNSTAASATITNQGGAVSGALPGQTTFFDTATAGNATVIATAGTNGASGGLVLFYGSATGGTARCELFGNGTLNIDGHLAPGVTIGSLEGDGLVTLGSNSLTVGSNNLDTTFAGVISGSGSLTKIGRGKVTLVGGNTYSGRTQVKQGTLSIQDRTGSLMVIAGSVDVDGGTFGGSGLVGGAAVIGNATGRQATLEADQLHGGNFIIQKSLKFNPGATCKIDVNSKGGRYSNVWAKGVTISEGAIFAISDSSNGIFLPSNLIMINNTSSMPIVGTFANLPDGGTITVGQNTYVANYHGGDGNDLLMMVNQ